MGIESFIHDQMAKREARGRSPAFRAEMAKENAEFAGALDNLKSNAFDAGVAVVLKTPTELFLKALKTIYDKKYGMGNYAGDVAKLFFGKDGVAHRTIKVAANAVYITGKGIKIGTRQLFKV